MPTSEQDVLSFTDIPLGWRKGCVAAVKQYRMPQNGLRVWIDINAVMILNFAGISAPVNIIPGMENEHVAACQPVNFPKNNAGLLSIRDH